MELKDQVCSLELARKIKELLGTQSTLFYWVAKGAEYVAISDKELIYAGGLPTNQNVYSAFTVAELGEMLPPNHASFKHSFDGDWICNQLEGFNLSLGRCSRTRYHRGQRTSEDAYMSSGEQLIRILE